jgi:hypothetical protein
MLDMEQQHDLIRTTLRNAAEADELPPIVYSALILDLITTKHRTQKRQKEIQALPVFLQAQLFYAYSQTGPVVDGVIADLLRLKIFSYAVNETWKVRLDTLDFIVRYTHKRRHIPHRPPKPRTTPKPSSSRTRGITKALMGALLLGQTAAGSVAERYDGASVRGREQASVIERLQLVDNSLYKQIQPVISGIVDQPNGPLSEYMQTGGENQLRKIFKDIHKFVDTATEQLLANPVDTSLWSLTRQEELTPVSVGRLLAIIPFETDLLRTPVYDTITKILPEIQRSMALEFTKMDAALQEQFLIVWILTLKMIEYATKPGKTIPLIVSLEEVDMVYEAFNNIESMGMEVVRTGSVYDHTQPQSVNNMNRYISVKKGVNTAINFINGDHVWREKIQQLEGDLKIALKSSLVSLEENLLQFRRVIGGVFVECLLYTLGMMVTIGSVGVAVSVGGFGFRRAFWSGAPPGSGEPGESGESVVPDMSDPYGTPLGFFECECGTDVLRTEINHETSSNHKRHMRQKNTMFEVRDLLPSGIQTRAKTTRLGR